MNPKLCLRILFLSQALTASKCLAFDPQPVSQIRFFCSEDKKNLLVTDGSDEKMVQENLVIWVDGWPSPGCSPKIIRDINEKGFYCDGHYLTDYKGNQELFADPASCQQSLSMKPRVKWN